MTTTTITTKRAPDGAPITAGTLDTEEQHSMPDPTVPTRPARRRPLGSRHRDELADLERLVASTMDGQELRASNITETGR